MKKYTLQVECFLHFDIFGEGNIKPRNVKVAAKAEIGEHALNHFSI
jgi:hypothetical protein